MLSSAKALRTSTIGERAALQPPFFAPVLPGTAFFCGGHPAVPAVMAALNNQYLPKIAAHTKQRRAGSQAGFAPPIYAPRRKSCALPECPCRHTRPIASQCSPKPPPVLPGTAFFCRGHPAVPAAAPAPNRAASGIGTAAPCPALSGRRIRAGSQAGMFLYSAAAVPRKGVRSAFPGQPLLFRASVPPAHKSRGLKRRFNPRLSF